MPRASPPLKAARATSRTALLATLGVACGPTDPHIREGQLACAPRDGHALVWDCDVELVSDRPATAALVGPDGDRRELGLDQDGRSAHLTVWRLYAETPYTVEISQPRSADLAYAFTTGALPPSVRITPTVSGEATLETLLLPLACADEPALALVDDRGEVLWYVETSFEMEDQEDVDVVGFDLTSDGVVASVGRTRLRQWSWTLDLALDLRWPDQVPHPMHHDLVHRDGLTYTVVGEAYTGEDGHDYVMDGFLVYDRAGALVAEWFLQEQFEPTGGGPGSPYWDGYFPGHADWAHVNGIEVASDGGILLSSRWFESVFRIRGDWTALDFGVVDWSLTPSTDSPFGSDFAFAGDLEPLDFHAQHHPLLDGDGRLMLFDNRVRQDSRATIWSLDPAAATATLEEAWSLGEHCSVRGSSFPLPNGDVVATCATTATIRELAVGRADPIWTLEVACASPPGRTVVTKAIPIAW